VNNIKAIGNCGCATLQGQKRFYNLGSGSWLEWANDTAAHCPAIHCPR